MTERGPLTSFIVINRDGIWNVIGTNAVLNTEEAHRYFSTISKSALASAGISGWEIPFSPELQQFPVFGRELVSASIASGRDLTLLMLLNEGGLYIAGVKLSVKDGKNIFLDEDPSFTGPTELTAGREKAFVDAMMFAVKKTGESPH